MGPGNLDGPHCRLIFDNSITLRNAQVRRISWVRGVRPVRERYEWPPHDAAPGRPPNLASVATRARKRKGRRKGALAVSSNDEALLDLGFAELDVLLRDRIVFLLG